MIKAKFTSKLDQIDTDPLHLIEPSDIPELVTVDVKEAGLSICPQCSKHFKFRKSKTYCSANCRQYACRPKQNSKCSPTTRQENRMFFDFGLRLAEQLYSLPPEERLGYTKSLIDEARAGNTSLRELLSNYKLLHPDPQNERWMFHRGCRSYCTIAQAAQNYCKRYWNANVGDVVYGRCPEPPTGEVPP